MNSKKTCIILLILAFAVSTLATLPMQSALAQTTPTRKTYPIIDAIPNPVGVGQPTLLKTGIYQQLGAVQQGWQDVKVTVTHPNGQNETFTVDTDSTGSTFVPFTPAEVGIYKLTTNFPQQTVPVTFLNLEGGNTITAGTIMQASTSETIDLVVTTDPLPDYPGHALPTEYWSRPIDPQLREWFGVSGNWPARPDNSIGLYNDDAPESAHVLWANELTTGGLMGGLWGDGQVPSSAEGGDAYEGKFPGSVILNGILYYQRTDTRREQYPAIYAVNLKTGEEWLFRNNTILSFGQVFYYNSYNYDGTFSYIWEVTGSNYKAYDPFTGNLQINITNVPSGTRYFGPSGEILILQFNFAQRWMALWNSTDAGLQNAVIGTPDYGSWGNTAHGLSLQNRGLNGSNPRSYTWNVSIGAGLSPSTSFFAPIVKVLPDRIVTVQFNYTQARVYAISLAPSTRGNLTFDETWKAPAEWLDGVNTIQYAGATNYVENGVFALWDKELRKFYAFSTEDGKFMWETESEHYLDLYGWGNAEHTWYFAYDKLYSVGVAGIVYAYDLADGKTVWTYNMTDAFNEPVTGENWWGWIDVIADGKVYVGTIEHSAEQPVPRGGPFIALNATSGEEIWRVNGMFRQTRWGGNGIIGDSIIATMDTYDQRVYAIGKGPSAMTIAASPKVTVEGSSVLVEGMVTDISPGTQKYALTARFPNGVPAIADKYMSEWMLYVYKQFERPTNAIGVPVDLYVLDANNNTRPIGTTTSDANGAYSFSWVPDIPGKYTVYASFAGSASYYPTFAQTAFVVDTAPEVTPPPEDQPDNTATYIMYAAIAIIIAIVIVGAVIVILVRKRP